MKMSMLFPLIVLILGSYELATASVRPEFIFHTQQWLIDYLSNVSATYPHITHLYSIGKSVNGKDLWVLAIGESPTEHTLLRPEVKYVGNIHGNEVMSRELLIQLIHYLVNGFGHNKTITRLLNTTRIHILVSMNPDGFAVATQPDCKGIRGRANARQYDLNRNFPDYFVTNQVELQPESRAVINWLKSLQFVLSGTLHGGVMVVNYPYDNLPGGRTSLASSHSPDNDVFIHLAKTYSYAHSTMHLGQPCPRDEDIFPEGIVNGADWYLVTGSMQDYNYIFAGCMDLTLEVSCCKYPLNDEIEPHWNDNKDALIRLLTQVHLGVKGIVFSPDRQPISNASVDIVGRSHGHRTTSLGEFWRILLPGTYTLEVKAAGYHSVSYSLDLTAKTEKYMEHSDVKRTDISVWPDNAQNVALLEITLRESTAETKGSLEKGTAAGQSLNVYLVICCFLWSASSMLPLAK